MIKTALKFEQSFRPRLAKAVLEEYPEECLCNYGGNKDDQNIDNRHTVEERRGGMGEWYRHDWGVTLADDQIGVINTIFLNHKLETTVLRTGLMSTQVIADMWHFSVAGVS